MSTTQNTAPAPATTAPADYVVQPWDSVFQQSEYETVAQNCMLILKSGGNTWRLLTEEEYVTARLVDGARKQEAENELPYFRKVVGFTTSAEQASRFSPTWKQILLDGPEPPKPAPVIIVNIAAGSLSVDGESCTFYDAKLYEKQGWNTINYYSNEAQIAESIKRRYKDQEVEVSFTSADVVAAEAASC